MNEGQPSEKLRLWREVQADLRRSGNYPHLEALANTMSVEQLREIVRCCSRNGCPIVARGGGASYTDGYLATREQTVCIDTAGLRRIDIHEDDMYVTAEAGVTFAGFQTTALP